MTTPLARLNEADCPIEGFKEIRELVSGSVLEKVRGQFGLVGDEVKIVNQLAKVLSRYQSAAVYALEPNPAPQKRELVRLKNSIDRALVAFENVSDENKSMIDFEIMSRDPFNARFYFKEQSDYWELNENSVQTAINKLLQISFALNVVKSKREADSDMPKSTINTPLDHLIQNISYDFEFGTDRKAKKCCYFDARLDNYSGQFFDFMVFILDRFAPSSYHSHMALGKRIERALGRLQG